MTLKQLWSMLRGHQTNYRCANMSWTYYPGGDPLGKGADRQMQLLDAIGPVLDAWDALSNDQRASICHDSPNFVAHLSKLKYLAEAQ